jgi:GR25 family glycosyltransferase involved in LPS biosynthesis
MWNQVFCISLESRPDRRQHARQELERLNLGHFHWVDAHGRDSIAVQEAFAGDRVAVFPPCFRCGRLACDCENCRLMPEQIGTWLSHEDAWRRIETGSLALICEDDVKFTDRAGEAFAWLARHETFRDAGLDTEPVLLRLGRALSDAHVTSDPFQLTQGTTMSNPCYALNHAMARRLLATSGAITTTVDIYVHKIVGLQVKHNTLEPPLAYELSWSTGELRSDIRPKTVYIERLEAKLRTLPPNDPERESVAKAIDLERQRFEAFRAYNAWRSDGE